jgi:lipopolysaccharide transport system ATP-binding protein
MRKWEIQKKLDEIIDFSGVAKYLDTPVKRYSSGMTVRLGFAVAAHLDPDVLIVDEVLAVGDADFQKKCILKMKSISQNEGRTILFVSHNLNSIMNLCSNAIILENGLLKKGQSPVSEAIDSYVNDLKDSFTDSNPVYDFNLGRIKEIQVNSSNKIGLGESINIKLHIDLYDKTPGMVIGVGIVRADGLAIGTTWTQLEGTKLSHSLELTLFDVYLASGVYHLALGCSRNGVVEYYNEEAYFFEILDTMTARSDASLAKLISTKSGVFLNQMKCKVL